ncbi:MAG: GIY-YIG nuclease family protein [bacterium]|nr:GIY-YIG nuclease family protein [bacterium]
MTRKELSKYKLPDSPGVYFFKSGRKILYIGKATSLRDRVRSYFSVNLADARSSVIVAMIEEAGSISWQKTDSVLEALILEANLIKRHQPKYNTDEKDDKSYNYLVITKEDFPRVLVVRGRELFGQDKSRRFGRDPNSTSGLSTVFGPYPQGGSLKEALKIVRKIFPFRDKCTPCDIHGDTLLSNSHELADSNTRRRGDTSQAKSHLACKPCFNRQIGLCPGVCSGEVNQKEYARIIRHIKTLFSGKVKTLKQTLEREMQAEAKAEAYEKAQELRRQISALEHIRDVSLIKDESNISPRRICLSANSRELADGGLFNISGDPSAPLSANIRIEAYDVAHTSGTETVAVMTVINNGEPEKESYRKFKIKTAKNDDVGALKEALSRRLAHNEWPFPRVFVVDGNIAQLRTATSVLKGAGIMIPVVAVVKNEFHKPERLIGDAKAIETCGKEILLANQEAHRFAVAYHRRRLCIRK